LSERLSVFALVQSKHCSISFPKSYPLLRKVANLNKSVYLLQAWDTEGAYKYLSWMVWKWLGRGNCVANNFGGSSRTSGVSAQALYVLQWDVIRLLLFVVIARVTWILKYCGGRNRSCANGMLNSQKSIQLFWLHFGQSKDKRVIMLTKPGNQLVTPGDEEFSDRDPHFLHYVQQFWTMSNTLFQSEKFSREGFDPLLPLSYGPEQNPINQTLRLLQCWVRTFISNETG